MTIGEKIALLRSEKKWSQKELGEQVGASRDALGKYERGDIQPPLDVATKMALVFNVSLDYLTGIMEKDPFHDKESIPRELVVLLTKIEKLPKSDRAIIESVVDAFTKAQLNSTNK